ncbi:membrane cofactor protein isoform X1 [Bombina bombina]|uniref:membrane cofactor protein isoform X1 n=1 Tax=Bombina bombina TaxID=8345 RepID=UPI00235A8DF5|nr:membrane cofactor protein isoform X1 [Bombina bombina]XP_053562644.1 membrane cofactor protein isoform X1 [Bombina bombina]
MMKIPKTNERNLYMSAIFCLTLLGITTAYRVNCPEPKIFNGKITMKTTSFSEDELETGYKVMDTVKVACNSFYNVKGSNTIVCGNDLKWHPAIPICQGWFDCPYPAIDNGHIVLKNKEEYIPEHVGHGFTWKNTVQLQCDSGFVMQGEDSSVCTFLRKWSPELPKCVPYIKEDNIMLEDNHENVHIDFMEINNNTFPTTKAIKEVIGKESKTKSNKEILQNLKLLRDDINHNIKQLIKIQNRQTLILKKIFESHQHSRALLEKQRKLEG